MVAASDAGPAGFGSRLTGASSATAASGRTSVIRISFRRAGAV